MGDRHCSHPLEDLRLSLAAALAAGIARRAAGAAGRASA